MAISPADWVHVDELKKSFVNSGAAGTIALAGVQLLDYLVANADTIFPPSPVVGLAVFALTYLASTFRKATKGPKGETVVVVK